MTSAEDSIDIHMALSLLAHELRLNIVLAALESWEGAHTEPKSYSELMKSVGLEDSGRFNYHLDQLRGVYLRETDGGYVPTASATALYRTVLATQPTNTTSRTLSISATCPDCHSDLTSTYEYGFLSVTCPNCDDRGSKFTVPFPERGFDGRTDVDVLQAAHQRIKYQIGLARTGQCPDCAGEITATITHDVVAGSKTYEDGLDVELSCERCSWLVVTPFLFALQLNARVGAALTVLGYPVENWYLWEVPQPTVSPSPDGPGDVVLELTGNGLTAAVGINDDLSVCNVSLDGETL